MVIQVLGRQVGPDGPGQRKTGQSLLVQSVGAGLHRHPAHPRFPQAGEALLQGDRAGGGLRRRLQGPGSAPAERADDRPVVEQVSHQPGQGGLAVGAGHSHHGQRPGGMAEQAGRRLPQQLPGLGVHRQGGFRRNGYLPLGNHPDRPGGHRLADEMVPVGLAAAQGEEQYSGVYGPAVGGNPGNRPSPAPCRHRLRKQLLPVHEALPSPASSRAWRRGSGGRCRSPGRGGTRANRRPRSMTRRNTGAATAPP